MRKLFFFALIGFMLFEIANVYFIMPMPGSQRMNSIDLAFFLHRWRWIFRLLFALLLVTGFYFADWKRKWVPFVSLLPLISIIYLVNFMMKADHMFYQPSNIIMKRVNENTTDTARLVLGVVHNGEAKAYPVQYIGYHHQVLDTVGGKEMIITYCTVCRTGRVFEPVVMGNKENFRLVGMDHFNAMFEDHSTGSWWRQATGEAVTGKRKGLYLPEVMSVQASLNTWLQLQPQSLIMQPDPEFTAMYDTSYNYENGKSKKQLTGTDSLSWQNKSWVVGLKHQGKSRAYDWNLLRKKRMIEDQIGIDSVLIILGTDNRSFFAYLKPENTHPVFQSDTLNIDGLLFRLDGTGINNNRKLRPLQVYQEFWHSWASFHPDTDKFDGR